ncbi:uracil-DNA glycosylase [Acidaminococcus sp.]|uniref:uracil-DNA glycosylase n=1 Tax=Acidaminococcus sp. TaxID=1872103 RepID=UPI003D7D9388
MTIEEFLQKLQHFHGENCFNPWGDYDPQCDIGPQAPVIRSANLRRYLELRKGARFLFIAEGLGYQGGHFSGMAMTSERILLGHHATVRPEVVLGEGWDYRRTSNPESPLLNRKQREEGFNEPTATIMWGELAKQGLAPFQTVLWNIFPFHPHKSSGILTNRTPTGPELDIGIRFAWDLLALLPGMKVIAIGRKSAGTLEKYGVPCAAVPHPSMGGANRFREAVDRLFSE